MMEELTESGGQKEAEAPPLADRLPRFVAELADCSSTVNRENGSV